MSGFLIPEDELKQKDSLIRQLIERSDRRYSGAADDNLYGPALRYSLLFSDPFALNKLDFSHLSGVDVFYNEYYWFLLFTKLHQAKHGYDAGLEQQAFKLLEKAPPDVDWKMVEEINNRIEKEVAKAP